MAALMFQTIFMALIIPNIFSMQSSTIKISHILDVYHGFGDVESSEGYEVNDHLTFICADEACQSQGNANLLRIEYRAVSLSKFNFLVLRPKFPSKNHSMKGYDVVLRKEITPKQLGSNKVNFEEKVQMKKEDVFGVECLNNSICPLLFQKNSFARSLSKMAGPINETYFSISELEEDDNSVNLNIVLQYKVKDGRAE